MGPRGTYAMVVNRKPEREPPEMSRDQEQTAASGVGPERWLLQTFGRGFGRWWELVAFVMLLLEIPWLYTKTSTKTFSLVLLGAWRPTASKENDEETPKDIVVPWHIFARCLASVRDLSSLLRLTSAWVWCDPKKPAPFSSSVSSCQVSGAIVICDALFLLHPLARRMLTRGVRPPKHRTDARCPFPRVLQLRGPDDSAATTFQLAERRDERFFIQVKDASFFESRKKETIWRFQVNQMNLIRFKLAFPGPPPLFLALARRSPEPVALHDMEMMETIALNDLRRKWSQRLAFGKTSWIHWEKTVEACIQVRRLATIHPNNRPAQCPHPPSLHRTTQHASRCAACAGGLDGRLDLQDGGHIRGWERRVQSRSGAEPHEPVVATRGGGLCMFTRT